MWVLNDDVVVAHTLLCFSAADTILHQALDLGDVVDNELGGLIMVVVVLIFGAQVLVTD